jgi:hypothetical protein
MLEYMALLCSSRVVCHTMGNKWIIYAQPHSRAIEDSLWFDRVLLYHLAVTLIGIAILGYQGSCTLVSRGS